MDNPQIWIILKYGWYSNMDDPEYNLKEIRLI
jgi:hypothetical protein